MNWEVPNLHLKEANSLCNYVCNHSSHKDDLNFCSKSAWHSDSHLFDCVHPTFHGIVDVVF